MNLPVLPLRAEALSLPDGWPKPAAVSVRNAKAHTIDNIGLNSVDPGSKSNSFRKKTVERHEK
jgi:hypothetical protein